MAALVAAPLSAQDGTLAGAGLVDQALAEARESLGASVPAAAACDKAMMSISVRKDGAITYPCLLNELVTDADDATMLVTLLLSQAPSKQPGPFEGDASFPEKAAAIGAAVIGPQIDPVSDEERVQRYGGDRETYARYVPDDGRSLELEATRLQRERETQVRRERTDQQHLERVRQERERIEADRARYQATTDFLEIARALDFCPADGRAYLARAVEYSTSPLRQDRMVGLWASERRNTLESYLNNAARCAEPVEK